MKRSSLLLAALLLACSSPALRQEGSGEAALPDAAPPDSEALSFCGELYASTVTELSCEHSKEEPPLSLESLQRFESLHSLSLVTNAELDLGPLASLPQLRVLHLELPTIATLPALPQLTEASILVDDGELGPVAQLTGLRSFSAAPERLNHELMLKLPEFSGLGQLERLDLSNSALEDAEPLRVLTKLQELRLDWSNVDELSFLTSMRSLRLLDLSYTDVQSLQPLASLSSLEDFFFQSPDSSLSLEALRGLPLRVVDLTDCQQSYDEALDLSPLAQIPTLELLLTDIELDLASFVSPKLLYAGALNVDADGFSESLKWYRAHLPQPTARAAAEEPLELFDVCEQRISASTRSLRCDYPETLAGLEQARALESLSLEGVSEELDLEPLAALPSLKSLHLDGELARLQPLSGLERLSVEVSEAIALEGLRAQPALTQLELSFESEGAETELGPLSQLSILELSLSGKVEGLPRMGTLRSLKVNLERLDAPSLSFLQSQPQLESLELVLPQEAVELGPLAKLKKLRSLRIQGGEQLELGPISKLSQLEELSLLGSSALSLSPLARLHALRTLSLDAVSFEQLEDPEAPSALGELKALVSLRMIQMELAELGQVGELGLKTLELNESSVELSRFSALPQLESLSLRETNVRELAPLSQWTSLKSLDLRYTSVMSLTPLSQLSQLSQLDLSECSSLESLEGLEQLSQMQSLDLSGSAVSDLGPVAELRSLRELYLERTPVTDLSPLEKLVELEFLLFGDARVEELEVLEKLANLRILGLSYPIVVPALPRLSLVLGPQDCYCAFWEHAIAVGEGERRYWYHFEPVCRA